MLFSTYLINWLAVPKTNEGTTPGTIISGTSWSNFLLRSIRTAEDHDGVEIPLFKCSRSALNHGCSTNSSAVKRSVGGFRSIEWIKQLAEAETCSGMMKWPFLILTKSAVGSWSWNGYRPTNIVNAITPRLHTSAHFDEYPILAVVDSRISGLT